jgi:hypothetical protein
MRQRSTRVETLDPANTCSHCPHAVIALPRSGTLWCPCEDCHAGGLIQGREPKVASSVTNRTNCPLCEAGAPGRHPDHGGTHRGPATTEDSPLWVDPIHSV